MFKLERVARKTYPKDNNTTEVWVEIANFNSAEDAETAIKILTEQVKRLKSVVKDTMELPMQIIRNQQKEPSQETKESVDTIDVYLESIFDSVIYEEYRISYVKYVTEPD